jgi:uncharacterized membrane protein
VVSVDGIKPTPFWAHAASLVTRASICRIALLAIVAAAVALRVSPLVHGGFWRDEVATWLFANLPLSQILPAIRDIDANPPGFYLLEWCVAHTIGSTPFDLELPSMFFAAALVVLTYRLGKRLHSDVAGLGAAFMIAIDPIAIREAADARCYTLLALVCAWAALAILRLRADESYASAFWLAVSSSTAMYLHYTGIIYVGALFAASFLDARANKRILILLAISGSTALISYLPWLPAFVQHQRIGIPVLPNGLSLTARLRTLIDPLRAGLSLWIVMVALWLARLAWTRRADAADRRIAWAVGLIAALQILLLARSMLNGRYAFSTLPLCYATVAAIAVQCASFRTAALPIRSGKVFFACVLLPVVMYASASLRVALSFERFLSQPKSGVTRFAPTVDDRADTLVLAAPDYYAPTLAYALRDKKRIALDGFVRTERPQWYRFAQGYAALWTDPRAIDTALGRIESRLATRTILFVMQLSNEQVGSIDYGRSFTLLARLEQRYRVRDDTIYSGSWEPIRVVRLERRGH